MKSRNDVSAANSRFLFYQSHLALTKFSLSENKQIAHFLLLPGRFQLMSFCFRAAGLLFSSADVLMYDTLVLRLANV